MEGKGLQFPPTLPLDREVGEDRHWGCKVRVVVVRAIRLLNLFQGLEYCIMGFTDPI